MIAEQPITLRVATEVTLEGRLTLPPKAPGGVVVCHPHPLYGGDMDNPVVIRTVETCSSAGLATIRFNFRGVGASTGRHGAGVAEQEDLGAAMAEMTRRVGRVALAGYSFGAMVVAAVAAARPDVTGLALVAPPIGQAAGSPALPEAALRKRLHESSIPMLIVAGDSDEYCPRHELDRLGQILDEADVRVVAGANHFFFGKLFPLSEAIRGWADRLLR